MSNARNTLIRIAYQNPQLRADLLPVISRIDKQAGRLPAEIQEFIASLTSPKGIAVGLGAGALIGGSAIYNLQETGEAVSHAFEQVNNPSIVPDMGTAVYNLTAKMSDTEKAENAKKVYSYAVGTFKLSPETAAGLAMAYNSFNLMPVNVKKGVKDVGAVRSISGKIYLLDGSTSVGHSSTLDKIIE